jgi:2,3,4,5-tetrahydropyridine-2,6-dicarboxylate N-succinyltransferase
MSNANLQSVIEKAWDARDGLNAKTKGEVRDAVETTLAMLDSGRLRVAEKSAGSKPGDGWVVHQWAKKAVLLSFRLADNAPMAMTRCRSSLRIGKQSSSQLRDFVRFRARSCVVRDTLPRTSC